MDNFWNEFPYTDYQKINLDYMLEKFPEFESRIKALEDSESPESTVDIYFVTYGVTSFSDISSALADGKLPVLKDGNNYGMLNAVFPVNISFFRMSGGIVYTYVINEITGWATYTVEYVTTQSPHFTGIPTAPTAASGTNSSQIATTAFVKNAVDDIPSGGGGGELSTAVKQALLACFRNTAWANDDGSTYYAALETALIGTVTLTSISAEFVQGSTVIYPTTPLSQLKQYLTVTAFYSDGTSTSINDYTLSGTLVEGTSTITVSYENQEDTFDVTVTAEEVDTRTLLYNWDLTQSIVDTVAGVSLNLNSNATQSSTGITLGQGGQFYLTNFRPSTGIRTNRDYEFDISAMTRDYTGHGRFITFGPANNPSASHSTGFIYRSTGSWQFYFSSWSTNGTVTSATAFVGKTLRIHVDENYLMTAYMDDVEIASATVPNTTTYESMYVGDTQSCAYTTTITGIRIYSTEGA